MDLLSKPAPAPSAPPSWLDRKLYPFTTNRFVTEDGVLSYVDEGSGPPVLFVHGTPSWSFEWRTVIGALASGHRCIAPDHLGFGLSDKPASAPLRPEDHARRLSAFVRALDLRDITLVVHDFGGPIGLPIALDMPERVARIVVLNTWMWPNADDPAVRKIDRLVRSLLGRFLYLWLNLSPRFLLPSLFERKDRLTRPVHRQYLGPFRQRRDRTSLYALASALMGSDPYYASLYARRHQLARIPMTIVWGEKDPAFQERHLQRWLETFPKARLIRLPGVGHFVAEEDPSSLVSALRDLSAKDVGAA
jgi:pimeloyl-ACP methyl ester carboxylesterase